MLSQPTTIALTSAQLSDAIGQWERSALDASAPGRFDLGAMLAQRQFVRVRGLADFWRGQGKPGFAQHMTDLITAAHSQENGQLVFVLAGTPSELCVYLSLGDETMTRTLAQGILPGIALETVPGKTLAETLRLHFTQQGMLTGIPSRRPQGDDFSEAATASAQDGGGMLKASAVGSQDVSHFERVVRGMHGATWAYVVHALHRPRAMVVEARLNVLDHLANLAPLVKVQQQVTRNISQQHSPTQQFATTEAASTDTTNYRAHYLTQMLEHELTRLTRALTCGQWTVLSYVSAGVESDVHRLNALLLGTLAGPDSRPDPMRAFVCAPHGEPANTYYTYLSSEEVATLTQLPREEVTGYAITDFVRFDVDFPPPAQASIPLGQIQQDGHPTQPYRIRLDDLTKHAAVVGVTGSGKTTTVLGLLHRATEANVPFLVIEPAKTEYRVLADALSGRQVCIYTLGNETAAPFRLNPFEFETADQLGAASVLSHIDFLKAVFNAAFALYPPMPYVLEMALYQVYEHKGWDLATGRNTRLADWHDRHRYPIFPTLTDLYHAVEQVMDGLGYTGELDRNVRAALKARIASLQLGSKGLMLDTARGVPLQQLLSRPTVVELEQIGNDDEKTFLLGLLLTRLYEYRRLEAEVQGPARELRHLVVFEEAHRLLKDTTTTVENETANPRAQAIETFTNMLAEIRGYGQGILVAEQIPSKLAPDVLKSTNLKIVHRLVAQDDRQRVGETMNLSAAQLTHLGTLEPGMAAVYAEGADHAYLVRLPDYKQAHAHHHSRIDASTAAHYATVAPYHEILNLGQYGIPTDAFGSPNAAIYHNAVRLLASAANTDTWSTLLLRAAFNPGGLRELLATIQARIVAETPQARTQEDLRLLTCMVLVRGCASVVDARGAEAGWDFALTERLRDAVTRGLVALFNSGDFEQARPFLTMFAQLYANDASLSRGPFPGCEHCPAQCRYRLDVRHLVSSNLLNRVDRAAINADPEAASAELAQTAHDAGEKWLGYPQSTSADTLGIGYCGVLHALSRQGASSDYQRDVGRSLSAHLSLARSMPKAR